MSALLFALLPTVSFAGDAEITLKFAYDPGEVVTAMAGDPQHDKWIVLNSTPSPLAAKTKADILIESLGNLVHEESLGRDACDGGLVVYDLYAGDSLPIGWFVVSADGTGAAVLPIEDARALGL